MGPWARAFLALLVATSGSCGRVGYGPTVCLPGMAEIPEPSGAGSFCIDLDQQGVTTWVASSDACAAAGKRLCTDAEWYAACVANPPGLSQMLGNWEWVSDLFDANTAWKRGFAACTDQATHDIHAGDYDYRCCYDVQTVASPR